MLPMTKIMKIRQQPFCDIIFISKIYNRWFRVITIFLLVLMPFWYKLWNVNLYYSNRNMSKIFQKSIISNSINTTDFSEKIDVEETLASFDTTDLFEKIDIEETLVNFKNSGKLLQMDPAYNCSSEKETNARKTKFIFVHIFKTAGSTMRYLFQEYAKKCHSGIATVIHCSKVTANSIDKDKEWTNPNPNPNKNCKLKRYMYRSGEEVIQASRTIQNSFLDKHIDILVGHVSLGAGYNWKVEQNSDIPAKIQYVAFFRENTMRTISGFIYNMKHLLGNEIKKKDVTLEYFVRVCKREIAIRVSKGFSQVYSKYLSTPQQRRNPTYEKLDAASKANLVMKNILQHKVLIGIVEKMPQSIEMLHHLMDGGSEVKSLFADISETRMNPSTKITTSSVVTEMKRDNKFMGIMNEY